MLQVSGGLAGAEPLDGAVEELCTAGDGCYHSNDEVEAEEDGFLCGAGGETVHGVRAGEAAAGELCLHLEAVEKPLSHEKANLRQHPEGHVDDVKPPEVTFISGDLAAVLAEFGVVVPLAAVMHGVHDKNQRRRGDEDDVEHPESVLGDWEGHVIADLFAARLERVTGELFLLIFKEVAGYSPQDQNPKHEHEKEPETTQHWGVGLEAVEEPPEEAPFTHDCKDMTSSKEGRLFHLCFSRSELYLIRKEN